MDVPAQLILVADVIAIYLTLMSNAEIVWKLLWILLIVLFPVLALTRNIRCDSFALDWRSDHLGAVWTQSWIVSAALHWR